LAELYDQLIVLLERIVDSGEIDSINVIARLQQLIATLKKNRQGSFVSTVLSWQFGKTFLTNVVIEGFKSVPVLKQVTTALEKTMDEIDVEVTSIQEQTQAAINVKIQEPVRRITHVQQLRIEQSPDKPGL
jgi:hypothetical protein